MTVDSTSSPPVTIVVESGDESKVFSVHEKILIEGFKTFKDKLQSAGEDLKPLILNDTAIETFETISTWLYTKRLVVEDYDEVLQKAQIYKDAVKAHRSSQSTVASNKLLDEVFRNAAGQGQSDAEETQINANIWYMGGELGRCGKVIARLVDVYLFGSFHFSVELRRAAILQLQRFMATMDVKPSEEIVRHAIDNLNIGSPLISLFANDYAYRLVREPIDKDARKTLSSAFLTEVLAHTHNRLVRLSPRKLGWGNDFCTYHEHSNEAECKRCRQSRPDDYDVDKARQAASEEELKAEDGAEKRKEQQELVQDSVQPLSWKARCALDRSRLNRTADPIFASKSSK